MKQYLNTVYLTTNNNNQHLDSVVHQLHFPLKYIALEMHVLVVHL